MFNTETLVVTDTEFYSRDVDPYGSVISLMDRFYKKFPASYCEAEELVKGYRIKGRAVTKIVSLALEEEKITAVVEIETYPSESWILKANWYLRQINEGRTAGGGHENTMRLKEFLEQGIELVKQRPIR